MSIFSKPLEWCSLAGKRFMDLMRTVRQDRLLRRGLILFLLIDLGLTLLWVVMRIIDNLELNKNLWDDLRFLRIDAEGGWPEWFNYAKILLLVLLVARLAFSNRKVLYAVLALLFTFVLVDDSMEIHEHGGEYFAETLDLQPLWGMRAVDIGEVITWGIAGAVFLPLVLAGLWFGGRTHTANGLALLLPFFALVFFALVVDQLYHVLYNAFPGVDVLLGALEDGGEMVAISLDCALAGALVRNGTES